MLSLLAVMVLGCEKDFICGENKNKGIIIESVSVSSCIDNFIGETFVVLSEAQLDSLYEYVNCSDTSRSAIDFNEQTLLGYFVSGGGAMFSLSGK